MIRGVIVAALLASSLASAAPSSTELRAAKAHFARGKTLQDAAKWDDAIAEYQAAYALAPLPKLLFNIGQCQRLKGDKPKAIESYEAFIAAAPDDEAADDARDQIASLKLRIQVEAAEQASKRAAEEAEAAKQQAAEAEAARRKWEREQAEHVRAIADEQLRVRRAEEEKARAQQLEREQAAATQARRLAEARDTGKKLRIAGPCILAGGLVIYGLGFAFFPDLNANWHVLENEMAWTTADDQRAQTIKSDSTAAGAFWIIGSAMIVGGITVAIVGGVQRSRAIDRAKAGR